MYNLLEYDLIAVTLLPRISQNKSESEKCT